MLLKSSSWALLLIVLAGCASVERPNAEICGINAKSSQLRCYNLKSDYDADGYRLPDAKPVVKPIASLMSLNGGMYLSKSDIAPVQAYIDAIRRLYKEECQ